MSSPRDPLQPGLPVEEAVPSEAVNSEAVNSEDFEQASLEHASDANDTSIVSDMPKSGSARVQADNLPFGTPSFYQKEGVGYTFEVPPKKPWGLGLVALGLLGAIAFSSVLALVVLSFLVFRSGAGDIDAISKQIETLTMHPAVTVSSLIGLWLAFGLTALVAVKKGSKSWKKELGLSFQKSDLLLGVTIGIALRIFVGIASFIADQLGLINADNTDIISNQLSNPLAFVIIALCVAFGAPFFEELFFRGIFLKALLRKWGKVAAVIVSSTVFGLLHATPDAAGIVLWVATGMVGVAFALLALKTNRLGPSIVAHSTFNLVAVILLVISS